MDAFNELFSCPKGHSNIELVFSVAGLLCHTCDRMYSYAEAVPKKR